MRRISATMSSGIRSVSAATASAGTQRSAHEASDGVQKNVQRFLVANHVSASSVTLRPHAAVQRRAARL